MKCIILLKMCILGLECSQKVTLALIYQPCIEMCADLSAGVNGTKRRMCDL